MLSLLRNRKVAPWATFFVFMLHVVHIPSDDSWSWLDIVHFDKWVHAAMFGGLTFLWIVRHGQNGSLGWSTPWTMIVYAILLELIQGFLTEHRSADIWDLLVDIVAILVTYQFRELILKRF